MNTYKIEIKLLSPTIVSSDTSERLMRHEGRYISGLTMRGAFLTALLREGADITCEEKEPKLIFHPLYPVVDGIKAKPPHPLLYKCKICDDYISLLPNVLKSKKLEIPKICKNGHIFSIKQTEDDLVININNKIKSFKFDYIVIHSTGINRVLRSSEVEMLYGYVCLTQGTIFSGILVDLSDRLSELNAPNKLTIRIGRGVSRGFGLAELRLKRLKNYLDKRKREIEKAMDKFGGVCVLMALSPVFRFSSGLNIVLEPSVPESFEKFNVFNGTNRLLNGIVDVSGFSIKYKIPKILLKCADIGSLFFYRIKDEKYIDKLVLKELTGFGDFSKVGLNILEVLTHDIGL